MSPVQLKLPPDYRKPSDPEALEAAEAARRGERRQHRRHDFRVLAIATIYPAKPRENDPVQVCYVQTRDICREGISIQHPTPLFHSQRIDLEMPDGRKFTLTICWVRRLKHGRYLIGCRFADIAEKPAY